jgi:hypothetical protein
MDDRNSRNAKEVEEEIRASLRPPKYGGQSERNDDQGIDFSDSHRVLERNAQVVNVFIEL